MYTPLLHRSQRDLVHKNSKQVGALKLCKSLYVLLGKFVLIKVENVCMFSGKVCS